MTRFAELSVRPASAGSATVGREAAQRPRRVGWPAGAAPVFVLAVAAVAARVPLLTRPLSPDEGGFLMLAGQWAPGTSLYGDYWVDRPPLLVSLFRLADLLGGGAVSLRLLGAGFVALSVLLAAALARAAVRLGDRTPQRSALAPICAAATAAVFLVSPLFGASEVDGELLAVPFVLAGLASALTAYADRRSLLWWLAAGALGVAAAAVKQNMLEVFVAAAVLLAATLRRDRTRAAKSAASFVIGVAVTTGGLLGWAALHGTSPADLWDAIVTFRLEASAAIARSAPATTDDRALGVAGAFLGSGALALVVVALMPAVRGRVVRRPSLLTTVTVTVLAWEILGAAAGGSYWLHYLVGTVPGLTLAAALAASAGRARRVALTAVLTYAGTVAAASVVAVALGPIGTPPADLAVERYLSAHERPGDTGVVAFGDPALLQAAHLSSPYPELWSLPVRVRDPDLVQFTHLLEGASRPTWVVVDGASLATWGVDPSTAQLVLAQNYRAVHTAGDWHIYHVRRTS